MRNLYLIRHARPVTYKDGHVCISRTDIPLSDVGYEQAATLKAWFSDKNITRIFSSPLIRAVDTAEIIAGEAIPIARDERLCEVDVGLWEGLSFSEIKERYPDEYAHRGENLASCPPPEGESFTEAAERMNLAVRDILSKTSGDIAIVSHAGVIRALFCKLSGTDLNNLMKIPQPYGGITAFTVDDDVITPLFAGEKPSMLPGDRECNLFFDTFNTPDEVRAHCRAVKEKAAKIAHDCGKKVNFELLSCAALLHDIARAEGREHPMIAADAIRKAGYTELADIIAQHHDIRPDAPDEAEILYLADTTTAGTTAVSIESRFNASREKCKTKEALAMWEARYSAALLIQKKYYKGVE